MRHTGTAVPVGRRHGNSGGGVISGGRVESTRGHLVVLSLLDAELSELGLVLAVLELMLIELILEQTILAQ